MIHAQKKYLAATLEALSLYVDLNERKVSEFEEEKVILMNEYILKNNNTFKTDNLKFSSKLKK
jgi:acyl-CoA thioester hydrolase